MRSFTRGRWCYDNWSGKFKENYSREKPLQGHLIQWSIHYDKWNYYIHWKGKGLCPVKFFIGHSRIRTYVQEWTRVRNLMCSVKTFTGHNLLPTGKTFSYTLQPIDQLKKKTFHYSRIFGIFNHMNCFHEWCTYDHKTPTIPKKLLEISS